MTHLRSFLPGLGAIALAGLIIASCGRSDKDPTTTRGPGSSTTGASGATVITPGSAESDTVTGPEVATASDGREDGVRKYEIKSGVVRYTNSILKRDQVFYFDDYGRKEALYDLIPEGGVPDGDEPYIAIINADGEKKSFDLRKRTGSISRYSKDPGAILGTIPDVWNKIPIVKKASDAEDLPPREILGKPSDGYQFQATGNAGSYKVWVWKGIPLYAEIRLDEEPVILEATSIEPDIPVPAEKFSAPSNVIFALE